MEQLGTDFNATGSVMSRAELEDQRRKRGECVTCGRKCFQKKLFKMIPITDHGRVLNGRCLNCHPLDTTEGDAIPAVSRPATAQDLDRFRRSQNNLRSSSEGPGHGRRGSHTNAGDGTTSRSRASQRRSSRVHSINAREARLSGSVYSAGSSRSQDSLSDHPRGATGRSSFSVQSASGSTSSSRGQDATVSMPGSRPSISRPNSNRSMGASSYYSSRSRGSADGSSSVEQQRNNRYEESETEIDEYQFHEGVQHDEAYEEQNQPHSNLHYYSRNDNRSFSDHSARSSRSVGSMEGLRDIGPGHHGGGGVHQNGNQRQFSSRTRPSIGSADSAQSLENRRGSHSSSRSSISGESVQSLEDRRSFHDRGNARRPSESSLTSSGQGSNHSGDGNIVPTPYADIYTNERSNSFNECEEMTGRMLTNGGGYFVAAPPAQSEEEDPVFQRMRDAGADFIEILSIMHDYRDSADVQSLGLQILSDMEFHENDASDLAKAGAIDIIMDAMEGFRDDLELQTFGCRAIWNASGTPENQRAFVAAGALDYVLAAMTNFEENSELQEQTLAVLANLGAIEENLSAIQEKGTLERLVGVMNKHANSGHVQIKGCLAISNLASHPTAPKHKMVELGCGSALVISMVMHPNDPELQEKALRALRNLSAHCDENHLELTNIGGIDAIISAMQVHRDSAGVQEAGAWTLSNLASNADSRVLIGDCGGIDVVVRAMWVHSDKVSVQEWCCHALYTLSMDAHNAEMVLNVGGISAIVNAMQAHIDSSVVQEMGCAVLCNLASDQQSKMRIVDEEALDAVVLAMVLFTDDRKVQERACQLLLQLSIAENFKAMQASNVGELVRSAANKFPETCGAPAEQLIHVIEGFISEYL